MGFIVDSGLYWAPPILGNPILGFAQLWVFEWGETGMNLRPSKLFVRDHLL